jgi:hypothetical protein
MAAATRWFRQWLLESGATTGCWACVHGERWRSHEDVTFKFVNTDTTAPVVTITGATADDMAMDGNLEDGYILPTTI